MEKDMKELVKDKDELERQIMELKIEIKDRKEMIKKIDEKLVDLAFTDWNLGFCQGLGCF